MEEIELIKPKSVKKRKTNQNLKIFNKKLINMKRTLKALKAIATLIGALKQHGTN